jgi:hypothetical protein
VQEAIISSIGNSIASSYLTSSSFFTGSYWKADSSLGVQRNYADANIRKTREVLVSKNVEKGRAKL